MSLRAVLPLALCALAAGCAADDLDVGDGGAPRIGERTAGGCEITLAGEVSGSFSCVASAARTGGENGTLVAATGVELGAGLRRITIAVKVPGDPAVAGYAPASFLSAGAVVQATDGHVFAASAGDPGLGALEVTRVDLVETSSEGKAWTIDGSFSASLVEVTTGRSVTLVAMF